MKENKCPECGAPLNEIPSSDCRLHKAWAADEEEARKRQLAARPWSQKIDESESFEELKAHLVDWFQEQE